MGFVKSHNEMAEIQRLFKRTTFFAERLRIEFLTTDDFVRAVLPPCLAPAAEPRMVISLSRSQSDCCGMFNYAAVFVSAVYGTTNGLYGLWMVTDSDPSNQIGRDLYGEPKKFGFPQILNEPNGARAIVSRNGTVLIDFSTELGAYEEIEEVVDSVGFEFKAQPAANGVGFEYDPRLVAMETHDIIKRRRTGTGTLKLRGTLHDPLDTIPVISIISATQTNARSSFAARVLERFSDHDAYLPYLYGRNFDDFTSLDRPIGLRSAEGAQA